MRFLMSEVQLLRNNHNQVRFNLNLAVLVRPNLDMRKEAQRSIRILNVLPLPISTTQGCAAVLSAIRHLKKVFALKTSHFAQHRSRWAWSFPRQCNR
jgi:hypothetical protein